KHPEQSDSVPDTYHIDQDAHNVIIDSLDMSYNREEINQNDDDNDLSNEREIEDFKTKNKSLESSNNHFKEANNKLFETNNLLYADYKKSEAELARRNSREYASQMEIECAKAQIKLYKTWEDKEINKVIELENKVKVLDNIVYKTGQSVQMMNMLNNKYRTSFKKPEFLKKAQRANPRLYDIGCYNDNLALMLAPESDEVIRLEKESRSKLRDLIRPFDYNKLNNLYDFFVPQREKSSEQQLLEKCEGLETKLSKNKMMSKSFEALQKLAINLEIDLQQFTAQALPPNKKYILKNTNVLAPGMYKLHTDHNRARTSQLPQDSRKTNKRMSFSIGVIPTTSVSRPQLKSNPMGDRVMRNNSQGKNQEVEDQRRSVKFSKNKTSVTACNDSLNAKTLNVNSRLSYSSSTLSKHMTGNLKLLINFVEKFLGTVKFGNDQIAPILGYGDLVQGVVTIKRVYYVDGLNHNLFSVGQFCDANLEVAFRKSICFIRDLKGNDLLTGSRGTDLYSITLQDTNCPNPIFLMAKATSSQAWLWHRRLSHLNFDTINLLSKNDIVVGLPKLKFVKDHLFSSCELGKAKRKSFHTKLTSSSKRRLQLLHMDLCGPMRNLHAYFAAEGIIHQTSVARTPEQNDVVERRNRTLVEAARTMLSAIKVPLFFWAEAISTACFTQNHSLVIRRHEKTPYHIINNRKPSVKLFHIFGSLCYIVRDGENLDKIKEKGDECIFVGYSTQLRAYRVFNKRTRVIMESIHVNFNELPHMASDHVSSDPAPECQRMALKHDSLSPSTLRQANVPQADRTVTTSNELDLLFSLMFDEFLNGSSKVVSKTVTTSNELDLLFSLMFDEFLNGSSKVVSKSSTVSSADAPNQRQQYTTPLNNHTTPASTCQVPTLAPTVTSSENINQAESYAENDQVADDEFINIFCTPVQDQGEMSSHHVDSSNMHTFYQRYPSEHCWTKYHPLEQVIGNPLQSVRTRCQLESDVEMYMFALTVSQTEPKNIKEAMADSDWIESMQEELHQFDRLDGNDLLTGSRGMDLYSITLQVITCPNPICLMAKVTSSQAWLWHRRLSHLNFDTINLLSKNDIMLVEIVLFIVDYGCSKHMTGNLKLLINFVEKFLGMVKFRNDQIAPILGYGDLVQGVITVKRVYYVEGLNHNLFSVGQFCDADLEVAFMKSTYFIRDLKGNDILTEGIHHQTSIARTPEQNGIVERQNRTLVEAARTMLSAAKVPLFFWAEAIATPCFTQNHSLVIP
nr:integrase, catalytic region, zinc finger, CCHC-type, peptidase aspartic, catalytic [Tanacetum cinerariifolium]